jgi:protein associated with RNAse G/E
MKKYLIITSYMLLSLITNHVQAQGYGAFTDLQNRFFVWDDGAKIQLESLVPQSFKVGKTGVAYMDNMGVFKVYKLGNKNKVNDNFTYDYGVSDNFIYYKMVNTLRVIDGTEDKELTRWVGQYQAGDSLIVYFDKVKNILHAYNADGTIDDLENNLSTDAFESFIVSDNMVAYMNFANQFKVYSNHTTEILESNPVKDFKVGRNNVAYVDYNNQFKIYQNGVLHSVDGFPPKSFQVGDNVVAYVDFNGYFKIFYNGEAQNIGYFNKPYSVKDNVVAYADGNNFFNIFHKGINTVVDNYYPNSFTSQYNTMCYINKANTLRAFSDGKMYDVSSMVVNLDDVSINYDVINYKIGLNMYKFWSNGKNW